MKASSFLLDRVGKSFRDGDKNITVLKNISAQFSSEKSYGIIGASGAGKSTLLYILSHLEEPSSGFVSYNNKALCEYSEEEIRAFRSSDIGIIFQFHYLIKELTVRENIKLALDISGKFSEQDSDNRVKEILHHVDLTQRADNLPETLSGGEQQRAALARALSSEPQFLLADEPTGNLDEANRDRVIDLLLSYQKKSHENKNSMGLLIATHDPAVYNRLDEVWRVEHGGLVRER